jgi:hypothetical protein
MYALSLVVSLLATASAFVPTGKIGTSSMTMKAQKTASTPSKFSNVCISYIYMTMIISYISDKAHT